MPVVYPIVPPYKPASRQAPLVLAVFLFRTLTRRASLYFDNRLLLVPRPKTKSELQELSSKNFDRLMDLVNACSKEQLNKEFPAKYMNRNVRDVLGHLHHWHLMFLDWYGKGMNGEKAEMPAKGYTWKMTPALNKAIQKKYCNTSLNSIYQTLKRSHQTVQEIIDQHTDEEMYEKKKYAWTGSTSLAQYMIAATSSHYDWATRLIRKCLG